MTEPQQTPVTADIYCRLSLAAMGDTAKVDDQERICRDLTAALGWDAGEVHKDNSRSAWQRDRHRPGWDAMLERVEQGLVGAIVVYHGDRLIRQPWDLEKLLNLAASKGIRLAAPGGTRDLSSADDQFVLRIEAAMACRESDNISRRTKAGHARRRRAGVVRAGGRGGRAYGFATDGTTHVPAETAVVREIAARVTSGEGAGVIARDLNERGVATVTGGTWQHGTIRKMMERPRLAGLLPDGVTMAAWEPVLPRSDWEAVRAILQGRAAGFLHATNARRYLLSGIALCGTCQRPVAIRHNTRSESLRGYGCINPACPRKVHRQAAAADEFVSGTVVGKLADREFLRAWAQARDASPGLAAEIMALEQRREAAKRQLESLASLPGDVLESAVKGILSFDERIGRLRAKLDASPGRRLVAAHQGITREEFLDLRLATRRALVTALLTVTILPVSKRGPGFDPKGIRVQLRGQPG